MATTSAAATGTEAFRERLVTVRDGLRIYTRRYPSTDPSNGTRPVVCIGGLTRNSRDFHDLAISLATHVSVPRDVYTIDMRGRGQSEHAAEWQSYSIPNETQDVIDVMTALELVQAGMIGTSRGGLISMVLASLQPSRVGAVVMNDIGPIVEQDGLARIAGYVGRIPTPKSWSDATKIVLDLTKRDFPKLGDAGAEKLARQLFNERNGRPVSGYDIKLSRTLSVLDGPPPALWPQFESLKRVPLMVIRGAHSDILSEKTVEDMQRQHPRFTRWTVPDEGHAPLLHDLATQTAIAQFLATWDQASDLPVENVVDETERAVS
jgi:pimeloyl-ACP methyl ester carboxylesterase